SRAPSDAPEKSVTRKQKVKISQAEFLPVDTEVYEQLKKLRLDLARNEGDIPAYMIFPDETLRAFARLKPNSIEAGRRIRGVGEVKARRYLPAFIEAIAGTRAANSGRGSLVGQVDGSAS